MSVYQVKVYKGTTRGNMELKRVLFYRRFENAIADVSSGSGDLFDELLPDEAYDHPLNMRFRTMFQFSDYEEISDDFEIVIPDYDIFVYIGTIAFEDTKAKIFWIDPEDK